MKAILHTDGASRHGQGEPTGPAGIGAQLESDTGEVIGEIARYIGVTTNNVAEYTALIEGLQLARAEGVTEIHIYVDSTVLEGHLTRGHQVKADHLRPMVGRVRELLDDFSSWRLIRVDRTENLEADRLTNEGIDASSSS